MALNIYHQDGTVWRKSGDTKYGQAETSEPIHIRCRFEKGQELIIDSKGEESASESKFFSDTEYDVGDYFAPGIVNGPFGAHREIAREIVAVKVTPSLKNTFQIVQHWMR